MMISTLQKHYYHTIKQERVGGQKKPTDHPRLELYLAFPFLLAVSTIPTHPQTQNVISLDRDGHTCKDPINMVTSPI